MHTTSDDFNRKSLILTMGKKLIGDLASSVRHPFQFASSSNSRKGTCGFGTIGIDLQRCDEWKCAANFPEEIIKKERVDRGQNSNELASIFIS
jgi:hypothetical protein